MGMYIYRGLYTFPVVRSLGLDVRIRHPKESPRNRSPPFLQCHLPTNLYVFLHHKELNQDTLISASISMSNSSSLVNCLSTCSAASTKVSELKACDINCLGQDGLAMLQAGQGLHSLAKIATVDRYPNFAAVWGTYMHVL